MSRGAGAKPEWSDVRCSAAKRRTAASWRVLTGDDGFLLVRVLVKYAHDLPPRTIHVRTN